MIFGDNDLEVVRGSTLVVNAAGPFFRMGPPALEACMDERVNYLDIGDDFEAAGLLLAFDRAARAAGITALQCAGLTPGLWNVVVRSLEVLQAVGGGTAGSAMDDLTGGAAALFVDAFLGGEGRAWWRPSRRSHQKASWRGRARSSRASPLSRVRSRPARLGQQRRISQRITPFERPRSKCSYSG